MISILSSEMNEPSVSLWTKDLGNVLAHVVDNSVNFNMFVYCNIIGLNRVRLRIPHPISDYRNLTDEFKEEYLEFMKKQNISIVNEFSGDVLYICCPEKRSRQFRLYNRLLQKEGM